MARPKGTTRKRGYKTSPGRPKRKTGFFHKVIKGSKRFLESPFKRRS